jgi:GT2 family glycosyltransferase
VELSVVIPCLDVADVIDGQLNALAGQRSSQLQEVIIADNGSKDATLDIVRRYQDRLPIRVVDASDRRGGGHARNVGARAAHTPGLAFCDPDDEVADGWLQAIARALDEHDFVAGRLEFDRFNQPWAIAVRGRPQHEGLSYLADGRWLPFALGGTIGIRKKLHDAIGGFDELSFSGSAEDVDYCWRLQLAGHPLVFVPEAVTHYRLRHNLRSIYRQARYYGEGQVLLYRIYREYGLPEVEQPWRKALRLNLAMVKRFATARRRSDLALALWSLGQRVGRLRGSARHRVLFP